MPTVDRGSPSSSGRGPGSRTLCRLCHKRGPTSFLSCRIQHRFYSNRSHRQTDRQNQEGRKIFRRERSENEESDFLSLSLSFPRPHRIKRNPRNYRSCFFFLIYIEETWVGDCFAGILNGRARQLFKIEIIKPNFKLRFDLPIFRGSELYWAVGFFFPPVRKCDLL